jgi:hypothetical protein
MIVSRESAEDCVASETEREEDVGCGKSRIRALHEGFLQTERDTSSVSLDRRR